jgi:NitT/TauT family transport system substrate-binding protein
MTRPSTLLRHALAVALALGFASAAAAQSTTPALTKVKIGCTATTDCANALIAKEDGLFTKNGIDAELVLIGLNSNIPAALMSDSIQIGGPTPSVFLQAVDGGLDLVAVGGASSTAKDTAETVAVVQRVGGGIKSPKDFEGKKVGAPGLGAFLHVLFRQWLIQNNVDPKKVTFVEVAFPTMSDVLKAGTVDAVVTAEPVLSRIKAAQTGEIVSNFLADLPEGQPAILYSSTRDWASKNAKLLEGFRAAITEASATVNSNPDKARAAVSGFTKIPLEVLKNIKLSKSDPAITTAQLTWWTEVMNKQEMLQSKVDVNKLVQK